MWNVVKLLLILLLLTVVAFFPFNSISFLRDQHGTIRISRIDRKGLLAEYDTYFTPGVYDHWIGVPDVYVSPRYADSPFDRGCFQVAIEFSSDTIFVYQGSTCDAKGLSATFVLIDLPNGFGELTWMKVAAEKSGKYMLVDCETGKNE